MSKPSDIITIALAEVGYREKASNASLDAPQANAGSGNWTKFARDLAAAGYYNGNKNGYAWCDVFVDWCFYKAFGAEEGQRIQCQTGDLGAACIYSAQYYMMQGRYDQTPRPGDQVFFNVNGQIGHTGIVIEVSETHIIVVEGNSGDQVKKLIYNRSSSIIAGYGHPKYDEMGKSYTKECFSVAFQQYVMDLIPETSEEYKQMERLIADFTREDYFADVNSAIMSEIRADWELELKKAKKT